MKFLLKLCASVIAFFVVLLIVAALIEVGLGERRPVLINLIAVVAMMPVLYAIWWHRKRA